MKEFTWKKEDLFRKIVFCCGWLGVLVPIFWIAIIMSNNINQEEKFWNPKSFRIVYIFGLIFFPLLILGIVSGITGI